jgi:hypothetical protein
MRRSQPRRCTTLAALAGGGLLAALAALPAAAQFGYSLPKDDFTWNWGRGGEGVSQNFEDFNVYGTEAGFRCQLTGRVGPAGRMSASDIRALEEELRSRLDFIYAAATYMNELEAQRLIDWARLACEKPEATPSTEEEKAERESRAREKMQREIERRRARQDRD